MPSPAQIRYLENLAALLSPYLAGGGGLTAEQVRDTIATALVAGSNVTITPNDPADTITIAATGGSSGLTHPQALARGLGA